MLTMRCSIAAASAVALLAGPALGQERPAPVTPYGEFMPEPGGIQQWRGGGWGGRGVPPGLQAAADHIISQQCVDNGWGWPHASCPTTFHNITAPITTGILRAFANTEDAAHLTAAVAAGDFDLTFQYGNGEARFGAFAPAFMLELSQATGDPTYSTFAEVDFFDELTAGTYGPDDLDTAGWIGVVQTGRTGTWVNLRPWEFHTTITTARAIGNPGQGDLFLQATLDGLDTLDNTDPGAVFSDIIGLAGGVRGLAMDGATTFTAISSPLHPLINGITSLCALADVLAGLQNADGSWYWHSNLTAPALDDEDLQTTAYAVLALMAAQDAGCGPYAANISLARQWMRSMQDVDGGFFSWPGGTHNIEVESEATTALATTGSASIVSPVGCVNLDLDAGVVTVTIDMSSQPVDVVGGQFFLSYDNAVLDFVSAVSGDAPFTVEVFESVNETTGTIDYAVGVPGGGPGTTSATTMAVLTFNAIAELCTPVADLVQFRTHVPPSQLTDNLGGSVGIVKVALGPLAIDVTPPVVTSPTAISVNADAGGCDASVSVPSIVATDNCGIASIVNDINGTADASGVYASGTTVVTWTVTDTCGNETVVTQDVTVDPFNEVAVGVQLGGAFTTTFTRCITFEFSNTACSVTETVQATLTFINGMATGTVLVPCGPYDCVTARDTLHTLARTDDDGDFAIVGTQYVTDFTSAGTTDDSLIGGNLNDDPFIDILDFGVFVGQFAATGVPADTDCTTPFPHADVSGDGSVGPADFTFIQINFLDISETPCCGSALTGPGNGEGPVTKISVVELRRRGLEDLVVADLNHDGWLDQNDVAAYLSGALECPADLNADGVLDAPDFFLFLSLFESGDPSVDFDDNGTIDVLDFFAFLALFSAGC